METVVYERWYLAEQAALRRRRHAPAPPPARILGRVEADPRKALVGAATKRKVTLAALSRMLGRPDGYLGRFARGEHPKSLTATEHTMLSQFFGVSEREMGVRDLWQPL